MILVIVAHPDDESFWFGGTILILRNLGFKIAVVCLTLGSDYKRSIEFKNVCKKMNSSGFIMDYSDKLTEEFLEIDSKLELLLSNNKINLSDLECVITHSPDGNERSHPQHIQCFKLISEWACKRQISSGFFSEKLLSEFKECDQRRNVEKISSHKIVINYGTILLNLIFIFVRNIFSIKKLLYNVWKQIRLYVTLKKYHYLASIKIDLKQKQSLLFAYSSQIKGLREYKNYFNNYEYLYLQKGDFWNKLKKRYAIYIKKTI